MKYNFGPNPPFKKEIFVAIIIKEEPIDVKKEEDDIRKEIIGKKIIEEPTSIAFSISSLSLHQWLGY